MPFWLKRWQNLTLAISSSSDIEVLDGERSPRSSTEVLDPVLKQRVINEGLKAYLDDANQAWTMTSEGAYDPPAPRRGKGRVVQEELLRTLVPVA